MFKRSVICCIAFLLAFTTIPAASFANPAAGQAPISMERAPIDSSVDRMAVIPRFLEAPQLDGMLDESVWETAWEGSGFTTMYENKKADSDTQILMGYDEQHLYIGLIGSYGETDDSAPETEIVEIILSPGKEAANYLVRLPISQGSRGINPNWGLSAALLSQAQAEWMKTEETWTAEVKIPFSAMNVSQVAVGDEWQFNIARFYGINSNPFTSFVPLRYSYISDTSGANVSMVVHALNQGRMAPLYFSQLPQASAEPDRPQNLWIPEQWEFRYAGFTEKELVIHGGMIQRTTELKMTWISPDGMETELTDFHIRRQGAESMIYFHHPRPQETGQYRLKLAFRNGKGAFQYFELSFDREAMINAGDSLFKRPDPAPTRMVEYAPASEQVQKLLDLIPENTGFIFVGLPEDPSLRPYQLYNWSPDQPWQMTAKLTGTVYPNEQFPEDQVLAAVNPLGEIVEYPYYEDEDGKRYFFTAHLWYFQKDYVLRETNNIASSDPLGAARLLARWAEVYQGYMPTNDYYWANYPLTSGPPYNYYGGVWYRWYTGDMSNLSYLLDAYIKVRETNAFELLSDELGYDVEEQIIENMFKPSFEYVRSYPILNHNMEYNTWRGLIRMSKATGDPSYMHEAVERMEIYAKNNYLFDGFWKEVTLSYHNQSTNGLLISMNESKGWSDPHDYLSPRTGRNLQQLDLSETFPALNKALTMGDVVSYPNGSYVAMQDTWANEKSANPMTDLGSYLLPATGIARLAQAGVAGEHPAIIYDFPSLEIDEQSVEHRDFPASGTVQLEANEPEHFITFLFNVPETDQYTIALQPFKAASYGQYDVMIDDRLIVNLDFYAESSGVQPFETLTTLELSEGVHSITFLNTGKREQSSNYKMGVVKLALLDDESAQLPSLPGSDEANPSQLYMMFTPKYGHNHYDPLNITLFAEGQELLPDIGYTHTFFRRWTASTLAHNTVVVNGQDMNAAGNGSHGGEIEAFIASDDTVQIMKASQQSAYPMTSEYSREPWMIAFGGHEDQAYVIDIFRVDGGERHEYTLGGDANRDGHFETELELEYYNDYLLPPGTQVRMPESETDYGDAGGHYYGYIYVQDVHRADARDGRMEATLVTTENGQEQAKLNITAFAGQGQNELFIGKAPSLRATRLHGTSQDINTEAVKYWMPKMVLRRSGNDLSSTFVTVMEPYKGDNKLIAQVDLLKPADDGNVALQITYGDITDIILSSSDPAQPLTVNDITLHGRYGFIRLHQGEIAEMKLIGGTLLQKGDQQLTGSGPQTGVINKVMRISEGDPYYAFVTDTILTGDLAGQTLIVAHPDGTSHGYKIKEVNMDNQQSIILLDDMEPGWTIHADGSSTLDFYPFRDWNGDHHFRIDNIESRQ